MNIEHVAYNVADPHAMARWYVENLGLRVIRRSDHPIFGYFLADGRGMVIEIYRNPAGALLDSRSLAPLTLHLALSCEDVPALRQKLLAAGAQAEGEATLAKDGNQLAVVRDPWGLTLQLVRRAKPLIA
jgi:catechol 2,3-dioxygenase-like lactoylglutathione lyase family enzyme